jgi:hypothetical protein
MKKLICILLCIAFPISASASDISYKVVHDGGSVANEKPRTDMMLSIDGNSIHIKQGSNEVIAIPASSVTEISYGQDVHRRVDAAIGLAVFSLGLGALLAPSKSKKHYVEELIEPFNDHSCPILLARLRISDGSFVYPPIRPPRCLSQGESICAKPFWRECC